MAKTTRATEPQPNELEDKSGAERHEFAEALARTMDPVMGILGIIFALVVLIETLVNPRGTVGSVLSVTGWVLWGIFVAEFLLRAVIAPSRADFFKRNWWQLAFLALPFLRLLRLFRVARVARAARAGRVLSSSLRAGRGAGRILTGRVGWLTALTVIVVLAASQLLYEFGSYESYANALYDAALGAVTGQPLRPRAEGFSRIVSVALAVYSVVVFATLAAILGAYFLGRETRDAPSDSTDKQ